MWKKVCRWKSDGNTSKKRFLSPTGFTLLEVMIALAIIATALVVLLHCYGIGVSMANESKNISLATMLAQEKMGEIELTGYPEIGESDGDFDERYPHFHWAHSVSATPIENLRRVGLIVTWDEGSLELVSYIAKKK
jgi:general secretion pathway protein I